MKLKYILAGAVLAAVTSFTTTSCSDKLDIDQHSVEPIDKFYSTDEEVEQGIVAAYAQFKTVYGGGTSSVSWLTNFLGDDVWAGGGSRADGIFYQYNEFTFGDDNSLVKGVYSNLYTLIYRCNIILDRVKLESAVAKRAIAEAHVLRAWANFQLVTLWGTAPIVDHVLKESEYLQGNSTPEAMWAFIEQDLNEAISSGALTTKSSKTDYTYRLTKEFAQAMLGKAYLWQKKNAEAAAQFGAIIDSNLYDLHSDLSTFGTIEGDVNEEDLFCMRGIDDSANRNENSTYRGTWTGLRAERYDHGFSTGNVNFCTYTFGFQHNATKTLYDTFVKIEGKDGYRLKNFILTYEDMVNVYDTRIKESLGDIYDCEGYYDMKYMTWKKNGSAYRYPLPLHVMRYDEVLCFAAEAYLAAGNQAKAVECINKLRTRAQAPTVTSVDLQTIKDESYVELCFEGIRYQNLLRWGDAEAALGYRGETHPHLNYDGTVTYKSYNAAGSVGWKAGKNELLPFPATEMACNPNMVQNPGW